MICFTFLLAFAESLPVFAKGAPLTGLRLKAALASPTNRSWTELPLRQVLDQLGAAHRVSIFLDRRVDPGQKTSLDALTVPLGQTLEHLADMVNTEVVQFSSIVYIGPKETARWLPAVAAARRDDVRKMPDRGRAMLTPKPMRWNSLATPRELVQALAEETGVSIGPIGSIPHDLWAAAELPRTTPADRLTLILSQFDKTFLVLSPAANGKPRLVIVDIPKEIQAPKKSTSQAADLGATTKPTKPTKPTPTKPTRTTKGRTQSPRGSSTNLARLRIKRFAVKEKPVGMVMEYLARQWNLTLEVDREKFDEKLKQRICVTEENVTIPELIQAILAPVGLKGELDEPAGVLRIQAR